MSTSSSSSPPRSIIVPGEKRPWWLTNKKMIDKYVKDAKSLISTGDQRDVVSALHFLDSALSLSPKYDAAFELKSKCLLYLRRFKDVADMLEEYIPSLRMMASSGDDSFSSSDSRERVKLLGSGGSEEVDGGVDDRGRFKCFSVKDLKRKVIAGLCKNCEHQGHWRYLVLGQACCHLGLMEDAMVLLQTGKRLATAAFRRESISRSDDSFTARFRTEATCVNSFMDTESESVSQLLSHIKLLLRRKAAALAALDAGLYSEAIRHFSKIVDSRRGAPQGFLAECYMHRATTYKSSGRLADAIGDCNRTLALDPTCIQALSMRATLLETIRCIPDCLHDLEHLKLLYNTVLRDKKLPGPVWKRHNVRYKEIPAMLCALASKIQELKQRVASGETGNVDYYGLIGLRRGCSKSELERAHLLLCLKHKPDKAIGFIERCEFVDERDLDSVKDRARMSALLLYRLLQKGYTSVVGTIMEEEAAEKQRKKASAALQATALQIQQQSHEQKLASGVSKPKGGVQIPGGNAKKSTPENNKAPANNNTPVYQGVFCRDLAAVGNLISQAGFNLPLQVKYEALSFLKQPILMKSSVELEEFLYKWGGIHKILLTDLRKSI